MKISELLVGKKVRHVSEYCFAAIKNGIEGVLVENGDLVLLKVNKERNKCGNLSHWELLEPLHYDPGITLPEKMHHCMFDEQGRCRGSYPVCDKTRAGLFPHLYEPEGHKQDCFSICPKDKHGGCPYMPCDCGAEKTTLDKMVEQIKNDKSIAEVLEESGYYKSLCKKKPSEVIRERADYFYDKEDGAGSYEMSKIWAHIYAIMEYLDGEKK